MPESDPLHNSLTVPNEDLLGEVDNFLREGRDVIIMTRGNSMLPFLVGGRDSVRLRKMESYSPGDVVLARTARGNYVLHRIAALEGERVTLRGDGNLSGTESCRTGDICGRAVARLRGDSGREYPIADGSGWNSLPYFIRRYTLAVLRRIQSAALKEYNSNQI